MAHKVMVSGTIYSIKSGKTLVGGTAYAIKGGRTLVSGSKYGISFNGGSSSGIFRVTITGMVSPATVEVSINGKVRHTFSDTGSVDLSASSGDSVYIAIQAGGATFAYFMYGFEESNISGSLDGSDMSKEYRGSIETLPASITLDAFVM